MDTSDKRFPTPLCCTVYECIIVINIVIIIIEKRVHYEFDTLLRSWIFNNPTRRIV